MPSSMLSAMEYLCRYPLIVLAAEGLEGTLAVGGLVHRRAGEADIYSKRFEIFNFSKRQKFHVSKVFSRNLPKIKVKF